MNRYQMLIGGEWVDATGGETFETDNPYLGAPWALVPRSGRPTSIAPSRRRGRRSARPPGADSPPPRAARS